MDTAELSRECEMEKATAAEPREGAMFFLESEEKSEKTFLAATGHSGEINFTTSPHNTINT